MRVVFLAAACSVSVSLAAPELPRPVITGSVWHRAQAAARATVCSKWFDGEKESHQLVQSDDRGRFRIVAPESSRGATFPSFLFVRDESGRVGWLDVRIEWQFGMEGDLRVELQDVADAHGRITDPAGAPIRGARVHVTGVSGQSDEGNRLWSVPEPLREHWTTMTDDDGRFALKSVPRGGQVRAKLAAPGFGQVFLNWRRDRPCEVRLPKPGSIRVRFEGAADPAKLNGIMIGLFGRVSKPDKDAVSLTASFDDLPVRDASVTISEALPGKYSLSIHRDSRSPYVTETPGEFVVEPGGIAECVVRVSPAAEVRGRVVDAKTRQGIARAPVCITKPGQAGSRMITGVTETDEDGRFAAFAKPGDLGVVISEMMFGKPLPYGYRPPNNGAKPQSAHVNAGESHTFPDLEMEPAVIVEGAVVDAAGKPVPGVVIHTAHDLHRSRNQPVISDESGRFSLSDLAPGEVTALRARSATATTSGAIPFTVGERNEPIRLVLSEANAFRVSGRVVDPDGRPIPGAKGRIEWRYQGVGRAERWGIGAWGGIVYSDAEGRFSSRALAPDDEYRVQVEAPGYGKGETALVRGVAGQTHDFGAVTLPRISNSISGMVVDARNRPIEGATVLNSGDGPKPITATTSPDGRFELAGVFDGPAYLCVHKPGYRFTGLKVTNATENPTIALFAAGDPPPQPQPDPSAAEHVAAHKKLTRHLLDSLWALPDETLGNWRATVLDGMARIDLDQAHRWFEDRKRAGTGDAGEGSALARVLTFADAGSAASTDADEAIGLLAPLQADQAARALLTIAGRLRTTDSRRALRLTEEAAVKVRALPLADRAWMLAEVGELLDQIGERDSGRKLLFEAADLAQQLGGLPRDGFARGMVAARLAVFDLDRAKALIASQADSERHRWLAAIAVRIASVNPDQALGLISEFKSDSSLKPDTQGRIALRLAETGKMAEAVKLAQSIENPFTPLAAVAAVAEIVGRSDSAQARSLIDDALDRYFNDADRLLPFSQSARPLYMAAIGLHARRARHPDLDSVVARIMACRLTTRDDSPDRVAGETAKLAMLLALIDPTTAKWLLDKAMPTGARRVDSASRLTERDWLLAVSFADPQRALGEIDRAIAAAKSSAQGWRISSLIELAIVLAQPTEEERLRQLATYGSVHWPGDRD